MNVALRSAPSIVAAQPVDPLDHLAAHLFHPLGADGVYARTALYEGIVDKLAALISRHREAGTEVMRFPPVMSRAQLEKSGYLKSFPNLLGCVCGLHGTEQDINAAVSRFDAGGDWTTSLSPADLVLSPAACYPVYPIAASRGPLPAGGLRFDVAADCFRREPSKHLDRLQSFRMREYVCIGAPADVAAFRERWMVKAQAIARDLGLAFRVDTASDPFFGRVGRMKAISQQQQALKFELLVPLRSEESPTACMSFNYHREHFGVTWGIDDADGAPAHTGCVAFGMDRLAVALFATHGIDTSAWPASVREVLALD
ncbi:amino acid--[acyl-carrier-protein] ligase [Rhodopseudomonas palustris]|uniref:Amino acid--[acyl-carrier-protein] ligase n=1 Tax=Rhodopseudomonas palustris TaxID=1076 RepID=A0A418UXL0_RHOPL|nr:amino acid--[acyl-carrier-protein] ligase [Rhodopseudomonas palustris]RJF66119.1 amino acid--[acyl-carrier-protein] ligase [Rhodopseudomonas palustris]